MPRSRARTGVACALTAIITAVVLAGAAAALPRIVLVLVLDLVVFLVILELVVVVLVVLVVLVCAEMEDVLAIHVASSLERPRVGLTHSTVPHPADSYYPLPVRRVQHPARCRGAVEGESR